MLDQPRTCLHQPEPRWRFLHCLRRIRHSTGDAHCSGYFPLRQNGGLHVGELGKQTGAGTGHPHVDPSIFRCEPLRRPKDFRETPMHHRLEVIPAKKTTGK
jgi:hypothetical protein